MQTNKLDLVVLNKQELKELFEEFNQPKEEQSTPTAFEHLKQKYLTEDEVKTLLGVITTWLWERRKSGELPGIQRASHWFYKVEVVEAFMESGNCK